MYLEWNKIGWCRVRKARQGELEESLHHLFEGGEFGLIEVYVVHVWLECEFRGWDRACCS